MIGSAKANNLDSSRKQRANKGAKSHCKWGHKYTPENTYIDPRGQKGCQTCRWAQSRRGAHYTHGEGELREQASEIMNRALGG